MANTSGAQASIGNGQTMNADAAKYFNALVAKIRNETGMQIVATEGTRTYARQKELYDGYRLGRIDPATGKKYNPAWSPESPYAYHLSGRAVDVGSSVGYVNSVQAKAWRSRMIAYGFRETVSGEPWHFEWRLEWASVRIDTAPASGGATPIPPSPTEEDDMFTDEDRAWLKDVRAALTQEDGGGGKDNPGIRGTVNVLAQKSNAPDPQAVHKLVRIKDRPDVFHSVDFHSLRGIPSEKILGVLGWQLQQIGALDTRPIAAQVITVETLDDLKGFGTLIGPRPADPIYATL